MTLNDVSSKLESSGCDATFVRSLRLDKSNDQPAAVGVLYVGNNKLVSYPLLDRMESWRALRQLCYAVGCAKYSVSPSAAKAAWKQKMVAATESDISGFFAACSSTGSWNDAVASIQQAVPRLAAVHLSNALIANRVPFTQAASNSGHPCIEDFVAGKAKFSIIPLLSAYSPQLIRFIHPDTVCTDGTDYGDYYVEYAHGLSCIGESSVREAVKRLVESV